MTLPSDQSARNDFIERFEENFSVVAAAGSGKTRAITDRIAAIARSPHAEAWLPTLVVVTYTNRAADEMRRRARESLLAAGVPLAVHAAFGRAFFGTIHSFCLRLLRQHGHVLGLPARFDPLDDDTEMWREFVQRQGTIGASLDPGQRRALFRLCPAQRLLELGRLGAAHLDAVDPGPFPKFDFSEVYRQTGNGTTRHTIEASQERLREWERAWQEDDGFAPLPSPTSKAGGFMAAWREAIDPIREWMRRAALRVAVETARTYRDFRVRKRALTFDDQIALAREILRHPEAARRIRSMGYRVILDEAQDTDPTQFAVLLELSRPVEAEGEWPATRPHPPRPGHFSMVGDFQQSIYGNRADLTHYRTIHDALLTTGAARELKFSVTFRLDRGSLDFVNIAGPKFLDGLGGQIDFVTLSHRPEVLPGQVLRVEIPTALQGINKLNHEAAHLARWLREAGLEKLRARSWQDVAILCPRKGWFAPLRTALLLEGLDVQLQSERDLKADSPTMAWFTALIVCLAEPLNSFELAGVLREIFGLSDHDLSEFVETGWRLQIAKPMAGTGEVADTLRLLAELRERVEARALFTAVCDAVETTKLRDRLLSLPARDFGDLAGELEDLLTLAAAEEAAGSTLATFAERLRRDFTATREVRGGPRDAVQLITAQKAKGSEWACVVVPFFAHNVRPHPPSYPRMVRHHSSEEWLIALEKHDVTAELKEALDARHVHEQQRLLYVTLTRAKHTLVLVDDRELFSGKSGPPKNAQVRMFRGVKGEPNTALFDGLTVEAVACPLTATAHAARSEQREAVEPLPARGGDDLASGRDRAAHFIKRNPSALAEDVDAEELPRLRPVAPNSGALHGTWWHGFVETLDWNAAPAAWDTIFHRLQDEAPEGERARAEWSKLRGLATSDTPLSRWLRRPGARQFAEMPFLWRMNESECLEGIIDLAIFDPATETWLVLDWKTNRAEPADLHTKYAPQLAAYWRTLSDITGAKVEAALYATVSGAWLPYDQALLADTWASISGNPAAIAEALSEP
jgi:ATP-dependent exoDNAse (exonuclease V) beta subunit